MKGYGIMMLLRFIINAVVWFFALLQFDRWVKPKPKGKRIALTILLVAVFAVWFYAEWLMGETT